MDLSNLYLVYRLHPHGDNDLHHQLIGKFILDNGHFEVLEDHTGNLEQIAKQSPAKISAYIHRLTNSMYYKLVNVQDLKDGKYPELIKEHIAPPDLGPESTFEYHRVGMPEAQILEFHNGKAYMDGHLLEDRDLQLLLDNVQAGHATLGYKQEGEPVEKSEDFYLKLTKNDSPLNQALASLREAVKAGHIDPKHLQALTHEIYTDSMVPGVGNKKAYNDFRSRPKQGVHIHIDGNDFGHVNKQHGFETGNQAITSMGRAIREAMDESVGKKHGKLFRPGGDEFMAHVPTHEHAASFARALRSKLEAIPPIAGTHNLSVSMGFGHTPEHAELALINAKGEKKKANYPLGQAKTHVASQLPGMEGIVPMSQEPLNLKPVEQTHPETVAAATQHIAPKPTQPVSPGPLAPKVG